MKTVKDAAAITGVSIRTLRYYDEIGLLKPAKVTETGYRLYDSKAIERLQEILFFKELEIPLENIRKIMEHPAAMDAIMQSTGTAAKLKPEQDENAEIYKQFMAAKETDNEHAAAKAVERLAENYKKMFRLDNARNILLDLANEYLNFPNLAEATDRQFGNGCSEYVAYAIRTYYGV